MAPPVLVLVKPVKLKLWFSEPIASPMSFSSPTTDNETSTRPAISAITTMVPTRTSSEEMINPVSSFQNLRNIPGDPFAERVRDGYQFPHTDRLSRAVYGRE